MKQTDSSQNDNHSGLTDSEKRFLTLNPVEWTRNNYPIFCRMYKGDLADIREKDEDDIHYEIIKVTRVKLHPDKT